MLRKKYTCVGLFSLLMFILFINTTFIISVNAIKTSSEQETNDWKFLTESNYVYDSSKIGMSYGEVSLKEDSPIINSINNDYEFPDDYTYNLSKISVDGNATLDFTEPISNSDDIPYEVSSNYSFDDTKIEITGGSARLISSNDEADGRDVDLSVPSDYVYNSTIVDLSGGKAELKEGFRVDETFPFTNTANYTYNDTKIFFEEGGAKLRGNAICFEKDGTGERYIVNDTLLSGENAISITAWIYCRSFGSQDIIYENYYLGGDRPLLFCVHNGKLGVIHNDGSWQDSSKSLDLDTWYFVAYTYDKDLGSSEANFYVDAVNEGGYSETSYFQTSDNPDRIGRYMDGFIDEVAVFDEALTLGEIQELYNDGSPIYIDEFSNWSKCVGWWRMGDDKDDDVQLIVDQTGNCDASAIGLEGDELVNATGLNTLSIDPIIYPNMNITFINPLNLFMETSITPSGTDIKYQVSVDSGMTWKWWSGGVWDTVTTINAEIADAITVVEGTYVAGNLASIQSLDTSVYEIDEDNGTPCLVTDIDFESVDIIPATINFYGFYDGNPAHDINVDIYNHDTSSWVTLGQIPDDPTQTITEMNFIITGTKTDYIDSSGDINVRLDHTQNGIASHGLHIDYITITGLPDNTWFYDNECNNASIINERLPSLANVGVFKCRAFLHTDGVSNLKLDNLVVMCNNATPSEVYMNYSITDSPIARIDTFQVNSTIPYGTEIRYVISSDNGTIWQWWNGTEWDISNGSYDETNTVSEMNTNINAFSNTLYTRVKFYMNGSSINTPILYNIRLNYTKVLGDFFQDNPSITYNTFFSYERIDSLTESVVEPSGTEIRYIISINNGTTWLYWNSSVWSVANGSYEQTNAPTEINDNLGSISNYGMFTIRAYLHTTLSITPILNNIELSHTTLGFYKPVNASIISDDSISFIHIYSFVETVDMPNNAGVEYIISIDDGITWLYYSDGSWITSDGYSQSNIGSVVNNNIESITSGGTFKYKAVFFTDDIYNVSATARLDSINITYYGSYEYPTDNPTIESETSISYDELLSFSSIITTPSGTSVRYVVSYDNGDIWRYYNGTIWKETTGYTESNTIAEINNSLSALSSGRFKFKAYLHSDGTGTPIISQVVLSYVIEPSVSVEEGEEGEEVVITPIQGDVNVNIIPDMSTSEIIALVVICSVIALNTISIIMYLRYNRKDENKFRDTKKKKIKKKKVVKKELTITRGAYK